LAHGIWALALLGINAAYDYLHVRHQVSTGNL